MARRRRFSIPTRIFLGFAVVLVAFAGVAVTSVVQHERTTRTLRLLHEGYLPLALTLGEARTNQQVFNTLLDRILQERDSAATRSWIGSARRIRPATLRRALDDLARAERLDPPPEDQATIDRVQGELEDVDEAFSHSDVLYRELFHALDAGNDERARAVLTDLRERERATQTKLREAWRELQSRISATSARAAAQERRAAIVLGMLTLLAIVVAVVVTWWSQRVLKPLPVLHERVQAVARGDLSRRLEPTSDDELGRLTSEFERMVEAIAARDARLREAAEAQRRLQRMQEQIVTSLRAAVVVVDGSGIVRTVNPAARSVLELSVEAIGQDVTSTGLLEHIPSLGQAIAVVAAGGEAAELEAVAFEGSSRFVNVRITPFGLGGESPRSRSVLVVADDVTEELETKARLIQTERLAAIGKMAAHVTHEVRNPLSSIGLNVEMLEDELSLPGAEARALLKAIQREIDRLTAITEEYLRLARVPEPRLEPEDPEELCVNVADFIRAEAERAGVELVLDLSPGLPPVAVDEQQLRQALLNLLRNAWEAMPHGGRIVLRTESAGDEGVSIIVKDEGQGLDEGAQERLFDLFYTTKEHGTGLGLPLTQQIVVAHGGRIRCESTPGQGTTFEVWLPQARVSNRSERPRASPEVKRELRSNG